MKACKDSFKKHLFSFIFGPALKLIEAVFDLLIPLFMKTVIDLAKYGDVSLFPNNAFISKSLANFIRLFPSFNFDNRIISDAIICFIIIFSMGLVGFAITMITQYIAARTASEVGYDIRKMTFEKIMTFSKKNREQIKQSKLLTILNADTYQVQQGVLIFIRLIVRAPFIILGALIISFLLSVECGFVFLSIIPLVLFIVLFIMKKSSKGYLDIQSKLDDISLKTSDTIEGIKVIKAFNKQEKENNAFIEKSNAYKNKSLKVSKINALINPLTFALVSIATISIVLFGGNSILATASSESVLYATTIITLISYLAQIFFTLVQMSNVVLILTKANVAKSRIDNVLNIVPSTEINIENIIPEIKENSLLKFDNVYLRFEEDGNNALKNISFSLKKGESLGIIGGTGSGKTSLINLIERFFNPSEGEIYFDGKNIKTMDLSYLRSKISLVSQKPMFLKGSVAYNIALNNQFDKQKVIDVLEKAQAKEFVDKFDDNIFHIINEGGTNLSGGQRQRINIARGLYKDSELLILDDATSALDLLTDKKVRDNIFDIKGLTKIIVSQRFATVKDCDNIIVLDKGEIINYGNHEQLLKTSSIYKEIYESQIKKEAL
ncbi:MAG: ABC transporter ATP-binding protein [Bacilli bacterium]|nr:ABC transporter ATP-binding protein [Bacilli bacterium]